MSSGDEFLRRYQKGVVHSGTTPLCSEEELRAFEFRNQERLVDYINDFRRNTPGEDPFTLWTIRHMHSITVEDIYTSAGQVRGPGDEVEIPGGTFTPSTGVDALADLQYLIERIRDAAENPATFDERIEASAMAFHRFLQIHPFLDGNGRVGRGLLHFMLYEFDLLSPPEQIYDFIEAHRGDYYDILSQADLGNPQPLIEFMSEAIYDWHLQRVLDRIMSGSLGPHVRSKLPQSSRRLLVRTNRWKIPRPVRERRVTVMTGKLKDVLDRIK